MEENNFFENELKKITLLQWLFAHVDNSKLENICGFFGYGKKENNQYFNINKNEKE